jgi:hypothetical protein
VLAAVLFTLALSTYPRLPLVGDPVTYMSTAYRLVNTGVFAYGARTATEAATPSAIVTPGYPLFLSAFYVAAGRLNGGPLDAAKAVAPAVQDVQLLLALCVVGLIAGCGMQLGGRRLALLSGLMASLYLPFAWSSSVILGETLSTALASLQLLVALLVCGTNSRRSTALLFSLGVVSGALTLLRPALVFWVLVPFIYLAVRRAEPPKQLAKLVAIATLGFMLLMAPWWIRNAVSLHAFVPLSQGGGTVEFLAEGGGSVTPAEQALADAAEAQGKDGLSAVASDRLSRQLREDPVGLVRSRATAAFEAVTSPWSGFLDAGWAMSSPGTEVLHLAPFPSVPPDAYMATERFAVPYQGLLLVLAVGALAFVRRSPRLAVVASVPIYTIAVYSGTLFINRYFVPAMPAVIVLAAAFVYVSARLVLAGLARRGAPDQ